MNNKKTALLIFTVVVAISVLLVIILKPKQYGNTTEDMENIITEQLGTDQVITVTNIIAMNGKQIVGFIKGNKNQKQLMSLAQFRKDKRGNYIFVTVTNPNKVVSRGPDIWVKYISNNLFFMINNPSLAKIEITNTDEKKRTISRNKYLRFYG